MKMIRDVWLVCCLIGLSLLFLTSSAIAASRPTNTLPQISLQVMDLPPLQSYYVLQGKPGTVFNEHIRLQNMNKCSGPVDIYAVDGATSQTSGAVYLDKSAPRSDVGAWTKMNPSRVNIEPVESVVVGFSVTIPKNARSGDHLGGIVAEVEKPQNTAPHTGATFQIKTRSLVIIAIEVHVQGPTVEGLQANGVKIGSTAGYQTVKIGLTNAGNVMLRPSGSLQVFDTQGNRLQNLPLKLDTFLPSSHIDYPVYMQNKALNVGTYKAHVILRYGQNHFLNYTTDFSITAAQLQAIQTTSQPALAHVPILDSTASFTWPILGGLGIILMGLVGFAAFYFGRKGASKK